MTDNGQSLLSAVKAHTGTELQKITQFRKKYPADMVMAAIEQIDLRHRAINKFERADTMWFTRQGLEQSTGEIAASWRAARFPNGELVADLCCGIGGDAIALNRRGPVIAMDNDPASIWCAAQNLALEQTQAIAVFGDALKCTKRPNLVLIDPSRRQGTRRAKNGSQYTPMLSECVRLAEKALGAAIKVSPAASDEEIEAANCRIEFVSVNGECREAVLWYGEIGPKIRVSASLLPQKIVVERNPDIEPLTVSQPLRWILEPDPALIRAHLLAETATLIGGANLIDASIAYLTANMCIISPLVTGYEILEIVPFSQRKIEDGLKRLGRYASVIKKRGVDVEPDTLRKSLKRNSDIPAIVIVTRVLGNPVAIICSPPVRPL